MVTPQFFAVFGTGPVRGRMFTADEIAGRTFDRTDGPDTPTVAIISASLARMLFPGADAVGKRIAFGSRPDDLAWKTVIGVVADLRFRRPDRVDDPQVYQAHVYNVATLDDVVSRAVAGPRFTMSLFSMFAVVALLLAVTGIYGVIAFAVGRRRRELGVRLALGARPVDVIRLVVRQGMAFVTMGLAMGVLVAVAGARALDGLVYGVAAIDWTTYLVATAILAAAGFAACYLPACRGARLDPATTLRGD